ncbi:chorismate mutase [Burkholderia sp. HI2714]|uniref:chorismate mutase n=1 Tax=Burkholderia sp. HI2714 TaxID=2015359 RepID=UPI00211B02BC|nr:chorismate mutase [Burkholderia sp. HI2714]
MIFCRYHSLTSMMQHRTTIKASNLFIAATLLGNVVACSPGAQAQDTTFVPLVESMAARLQTAYPVALSKIDSGKPVYDKAREAQVIANVKRVAPTHQIASEDAAAVFSDQIEASKVAQYALLNDWRRAGQAPSAPRRTLEDIRTELDRLQGDILRELYLAESLRKLPDCKIQVAKSVEHVSKDGKFNFNVEQRVTLDRAVASVCLPSP